MPNTLGTLGMNLEDLVVKEQLRFGREEAACPLSTEGYWSALELVGEGVTSLKKRAGVSAGPAAWQQGCRGDAWSLSH